jgi:aminoglycoside phosphotransferase (APT) family kinase protein
MHPLNKPSVRSGEEHPVTVAADLPGLSVPALEAHLHAVRPGLLQGPLSAELIAGGRSNLTFLLTDGHCRWVLRRPPLGHVLATAHDMGREHRLLAALVPTRVPVPRPVLLADDTVLGAPFYVMEFADGRVLRERADLDRLSSQEAESLASELVSVLAELHRVDVAEVGLSDLGRPEGYLERQLSRWARQLQASRTRDLPELERLGARLGERLPDHQGRALVHGDYRLDNVVVAADGRVLAVLDWEMSTQGDPLADLASAVMWWDGLRGLDSPVAAVPGEVPGFPPGEHLVAAYGRATGRDLSDLAWYIAFAYYKMAAIFEGIHYRSQQGLTVGEGFELLGALVPDLVVRGHDALAAR